MARITITDLARITGFSKTTISHVLNKTPGARIRSGTRELIVKAAREHNYVPNFFARNIIRGRTLSLGFLTHSLEEAEATGELQGAEAACRAAGYQILIINAAGSEKSEDDLVQSVIERGIEGLYADRLDRPEEAADRLKSFGIPLVLGVSVRDDLNVDCVCEETEAGFHILKDRLQTLGHRSLALVYSRDPQQTQRRDVAHQVLGDAGFSIQDVETTDGVDLDRLAATATGSDSPTVAVCFSEFLGVGLLTHLAAHDRRAPNDLSIVVTGSRHDAIFEKPKLTAVVWPTDDRGRKAVAQLVQKANSDNGSSSRYVKTTLPPQWIEGETLGAVGG